MDVGRLRNWLVGALRSFVGDPPDSDFQLGYVAALGEAASAFNECLECLDERETNMRRISVYVGDPIEQALACLAGDDGENRSARLNSVCARYLAMVTDELRRLDLTRNEWCAIMDANNGMILSGLAGTPQELMVSMLWANVHDTPELGQKWRIDQAELVRRLHSMPKSTLIVIAEVVERFWSRASMDTDAALRDSGVIAGEKCVEVEAKGGS